MSAGYAFDRFWQAVALLASAVGLALGLFGDPPARSGTALREAPSRTAPTSSC